MLAHLASRYPLLLAVLVQLAALVVAVVGIRLWASFAGQRPSLLALVCLHAVAAVVESLRVGDNLPLSMLTGRRRPLDESSPRD